MSRFLLRAIALALAGALAGGAFVVLFFARHPDVFLDMDEDLPRFATGFHGIERTGDLTFAWTTGRAALLLRGIDRRWPWHCVVRARGAHPPGTPQPTVALEVDGVRLAGHTAGDDFTEISVTAPASPSAPTLRLAIVSAPVFTPGPSDRRELGAQVDWVTCRPVGAGLTWPPRRALLSGVESGAIFGAALGVTAMSGGAASAAIGAIAVFQALPLASGAAPYTTYEDRAVWLACWIALAFVGGVKLVEWRIGTTVRGAGLFALAFTAGSLHLKLLALLHPSKGLVDAVFHAHRLEAVLGGSYYFTQPMPNGVSFPYAIGLYVFAAPWAALASDHVALLRIVVSVTEAFAGLLLYPLVVRFWGDRLAGAIAVILFCTAPLTYGVVGNANLTNAFGNSAAIIVVAAATLWALGPRQLWQVAGLTSLAAWALMSHVSTAGLLFVTLMAAAALYWTIGGRPLRRPALSIFVATTVASILAVVLYYGHFSDAYRTLQRTQVESSAPADSAGTNASAPAPKAAGTPLVIRTASALILSASAVGWPILLLAMAGLWRVWRDGSRDRLVLTIAAWGVAYVVFLGVGALTPVDPSYERYSVEFVARTIYATFPAGVLLAGRGAAWGWQAGLVPRLVSAALVAYALVVGLEQWQNWFL